MNTENDEDVIKSTANPIYKDLLSVKEKGKDKGLVLVEGEDLADLAKDKGCLKKIAALEYTYRYREIPQVLLSRELYRQLSSYNSLPKVIGLASFALKKGQGEKALFLDGIQDPGNLGTIERSALAFGFTSLFLSQDCVSPFNFKAVQASKGALFGLDISYAKLSELKEDGYQVIASDLEGEDAEKIQKPSGKFVLAVGNEGQGIRKENLALADQKAFLKMNREIDSLNAAIAASIFMYLWRD